MKKKILCISFLLLSLVAVTASAFLVEKDKFVQIIRANNIEALSQSDEQSLPRLIPESRRDWYIIVDDASFGGSFGFNGLTIHFDVGFKPIFCCGKGAQSDYCDPYSSDITTSLCKEHEKGKPFNW